jgi:outer membrane protein
MSEAPNTNPISQKSKISNTTILNVVLFIGLIVLYALNFWPVASGNTKNAEVSQSEYADFTEMLADGAFHIAYVNSDSIMRNYKLAIDMRKNLETATRRLENDITKKQRTFQEDVESFQRQVQLGMLNQERGQAREQELMERQQQLRVLNDTYTNQLMAQEMEMNNELYKKITDILERFNEQAKFDYILGFSPGGGILYANQKHDITAQILERLNREYEAKK